MKHNISVFTLIAAAVLSAGCEHDLNMNMVPDSIGFPGTDRIVEVPIYDEAFTGSVIKNGKGFDDAIVKIGVCTEDELAEVDTTGFGILSASSYELSERAFRFEKDDIRKTFQLTWNKDDVFRSMRGKECIIPLKLYDATVELKEDRSYLFIKPKAATVGLKSKDVLECKDLSVRNIYPDSESIGKLEKGSINVEMDMVVTSCDVDVEAAVDNSLIDGINASLGAEYMAAPDGLVTFVMKTVTIDAGKTITDLEYVIDYDVLFDEKGDFITEGGLIVPVCIRSVTPSNLYISNSYAFMVFNLSDANKVTPPAGIEPVAIMGPGWDVLEGNENSMDGDPNIESDWYYGRYNASHLVDGNFTWPDGAFCTWYWTYPEFPISFVFDTCEEHIWDKFYKVDSNSYQGQLQDFEVWVAREYLEDKTEWVLAAQGNSGTNGWQAFNVSNIDKFTYEIPFVEYTRGRYVKLVITKCAGAYGIEGGYAGGGGYLSEFYGTGW